MALVKKGCVRAVGLAGDLMPALRKGVHKPLET